MKGILKDKKTELNSVAKVEEQSHSIGAVRWNLPEETVQVHSSAPTSPFRNSKSSTLHFQQRQHQHNLKDLRSLQECINFLQAWKSQVAEVCKKSNNGGKGNKSDSATSNAAEDPRTERSLEESRKLILQWADELSSVDKLSKLSPWLQERFKHSKQVEKTKEDPNEMIEQSVMEWAKELQSVSESCGMLGDELTQMLRLLGLKKKRLVSLMPLLEFITWSLLKDDSKAVHDKDDEAWGIRIAADYREAVYEVQFSFCVMPFSREFVSQLWLTAKQRSWKAGTPQYIPKSVWEWITSASVDVSLDPLTAHPWLQVSDDQKKVQEALNPSDLPSNPQRFDSWPCVLGCQSYTSGRCYWEVDLANNGYWRVGVTTESSERHGRFPMKVSKGYWTLWKSTRQFYACTEPETPLPLTLVPKKIGIYIDYEEGQISFYNVDNKSHIFTFTAYFSDKLYPFFAPLDGRTVITVSSAHEDCAL